MQLNSPNPKEPKEREVGYLVVRVSTALGAIPLEKATVNIRPVVQESSGVIYSLLTNSDGTTRGWSLLGSVIAGSFREDKYIIA